MRAAHGPALAAALALAGLSCAAPRGTAERPAVTSFESRGTQALDEGEVRAKLATQATDAWWKLFWRNVAYFDEDAFANDRKRVERLYQAEGYYEAKVEEAEALPDGAGRVKVRMRVDEGRPATVAELRIDGMEGAPEARAKLGKLPLREGQRFTEAAFDATRAAILRALETTGYAKAEVQHRAQVN